MTEPCSFAADMRRYEAECARHDKHSAEVDMRAMRMIDEICASEKDALPICDDYLRGDAAAIGDEAVRALLIAHRAGHLRGIPAGPLLDLLDEILVAIDKTAEAQ